MFCSKCGNKNEDGEKFCAACGTPTEAAKTPDATRPAPVATAPKPAKPSATPAVAAGGKKKKSKLKKVLFAVIALAVVIVAIELITSGDGATNLDRDRATEFYENAAGHILELQPIVAHFGRAPFYIRGNVYGPLANGTWTRSGNTITVIQEHSNTYWIEPRELQWTVQGDSVVTGEFGTFTRLSRSRARAFERTLPWMRYTLIQ